MDQLGIIQLFLIAKYMWSYFQTSSSEVFDFLITSLVCGKGREELMQNCISQGNLGTGLPSARGTLTEHIAVLPARIFSSLLPLPSIRRDETAAEDGIVLMHGRNFLTGNCFKTIQYLCCWSWHWQPTDTGVLISSFALRIVHRAALVRDITLFCVLV